VLKIGNTASKASSASSTPEVKFVCPTSNKTSCSEHTSLNGVKYYILTYFVQITGETVHDIIVVVKNTEDFFSFEDKNKYNELYDEYQKVFPSLKIIE
jgi:hypothetical protein